MNRLTASAVTVKIQAVWPDRPWSQARVEQWTDVLEGLDERLAEATLVRLRSSHDKCPSIAEFVTLARPSHTGRGDAHALSCMCGGSGWVSATAHDELSSWQVWSRCPDGPPTSFVEPSEEYDPVAGVEAFATFKALEATAATREDLAQACFAAAAAYRNATHRALFR